MIPLYKHVNNTDVAVEVIKKYYIKEKDMYAFKFGWWAVGKAKYKPRPMLIFQRFKIPREVWLRDWKLYNRETRE